MFLTDERTYIPMPDGRKPRLSSMLGPVGPLGPGMLGPVEPGRLGPLGPVGPGRVCCASGLAVPQTVS